LRRKEFGLSEDTATEVAAPGFNGIGIVIFTIPKIPEIRREEGANSGASSWETALVYIWVRKVQVLDVVRKNMEVSFVRMMRMQRI
jgi:hypothetical protein